jgi:hypothetical protein
MTKSECEMPAAFLKAIQARSSEYEAPPPTFFWRRGEKTAAPKSFGAAAILVSLA